MEISVVSDVHTEFMPDGGESFVASLPVTDALVVAGDLGDGRTVEKALHLLAGRFEHVVYVPGNHEYYGESTCGIASIRDALVTHPALGDRIHWLENSAVELNGQRFLGGTLWFGEVTEDREYLKYSMTDYYRIQGFEPWVYQENAFTRSYLLDNVRDGDIVVTHHLPSHLSVHPKYHGSMLNRFFLGTLDMSLHDLILRAKPKAWVHGHTHESVDRMVGETRILCNPYGYEGHEINPNFSRDVRL